MERLALGIDLGGTKTEAVVARFEPFEELARLRVPTERDAGYEAIVANTARLAHAVARTAGVDVAQVPIGVGMPGGIRRSDGCVKNSNTVCLNGRPFRSDLQHAMKRALVFDNDANAFALAEAKLGAGRGHEDGVVFGVILGTGVGGGLVLGGRVWDGRQGIAGEWGHHGVWAGRPGARSCYCGQRGCVEQYLSGPAVEADYAARAGTARSLAEIVAREATDPHAAAAIEELVASFGRAMANVLDVLDPSIVVLGGGVSKVALLYDRGVEAVRRCVFNDELTTPIVKHEVGDSAGVFGAALRALAA
jgi:fructokinase